MTESNPAFKAEISVKWIKSESGNTYLCTADALDRIDNPTEDDLRSICVDESANPQNN